MKYNELDRQCGLKEFDDIDVVGLVHTARADMAKERPTSPGQLRGGSVGAIIDNQVYGICHRKAFLRFSGVETPLPANIELMTTQGEQNEEIWLTELRYAIKNGAKAKKLKVKDQTEFECIWDTGIIQDVLDRDGIPTGEKSPVMGSGSPDIVFWKGKKPVLGLELKNLSKDSTAIGAHYDIRPKTDHLIQAANYSLRMGDMYCGGKPLPYQLVYSSRSLWTIHSNPDNPRCAAEKRKQVILSKGWDVDWKFGRPSSIMPFHRVYNLHWDIDGTLRYWTPGYKQWVKTKLTRKSIDDYYAVVAKGITENNNLGPKPTTKHLDGKSSYSPCGFCDFNKVCEIGSGLTPTEFIDRAQVVANDQWAERSETKDQ